MSVDVDSSNEKKEERKRFRSAVIDLFFNQSDFDDFPFDLKSDCDLEGNQDFSWIYNDNTPCLFGKIYEFVFSVEKVFKEHEKITFYNSDKKKENLLSLNSFLKNPDKDCFPGEAEYKKTSFLELLNSLKGLREQVKNAVPMSESDLNKENLVSLLLLVDLLFIKIDASTAFDYGFQYGTI